MLLYMNTNLRQYDVGIFKCLFDLQHSIRGPANVIPWYEWVFNAQHRWPVTLRHVLLHLDQELGNIRILTQES